MLKCINKTQGFSLIELILSLGILAIGITYCFQAISYTSKVAATSSRMIESILLTEDLLQEIEFKSLVNMTFEPEYQDENADFVWGYELLRNDTLNVTVLDYKLDFKTGPFKKNIRFTTYLINESKT